jgi:ketosteroid isomerase-like protein
MMGSGIDLYDATEMRTEIHTIVADDRHVAVRLTFHTRTSAGVPYTGDYQFLFAVHNGCITEVWEQPDTLYQEQMGVFARYVARP